MFLINAAFAVVCHHAKNPSRHAAEPLIQVLVQLKSFCTDAGKSENIDVNISSTAVKHEVHKDTAHHDH